MAQPTQNGLIKFLFKGIILPVLVLVLIVGIGVGVVGSMTPEKLKIADIEFGEGITLRSLGFADMKIFDIIKMATALFKEPNLSDIVSNPPNETTDGQALTSNLGNGSVTNESGEIDYLAILEEKVVYDDEYLLEYDDTTIAHLINKIISAGVEKAEGEEDEESADAVKAFNELAAKVEEVTIVSGTTTKSMRFVISINIRELLDKAIENADNPAIAFALNRVPSKVYLVSNQSIEVDVTGKLVFTSVSLKINDQDNQVSQIILKLLSEMIDEEGGENLSAEANINEGFGKIVSSLVENLGQVGNATFNPTTRKIQGNKVIGIVGVQDGKISVITYTEDVGE